MPGNNQVHLARVRAISVACLAFACALSPAVQAAKVSETSGEALALTPPSSTEGASESSLSAPASLAQPTRQIRVGERLSFHGRWFGIPVGTGWIEVKELTSVAGRPAYHIEAQGHSNALLSTFYPIHDVIHSYLDAATFQPLRFEKYQREGHYRAEEIVTFDYARGVGTYRSLLNHSVKEIPISSDTHDIISAFYWLRMQPGDPQQSLHLNIYSDEKVYQTELKPLRVVGLEILRKTFRCLVVEPVAAFRGIFVRRGRMWVYVSADEYRLPLFVKIATPWGPMTGVLDPAALSQARSDVLPRHLALHRS